jgi:hypothetical protein
LAIRYDDRIIPRKDDLQDLVRALERIVASAAGEMAQADLHLLAQLPDMDCFYVFEYTEFNESSGHEHERIEPKYEKLNLSALRGAAARALQNKT